MRKAQKKLIKNLRSGSKNLSGRGIIYTCPLPRCGVQFPLPPVDLAAAMLTAHVAVLPPMMLFFLNLLLAGRVAILDPERLTYSWLAPWHLKQYPL